jgi:hypothetical protein
VSTQLSLRDVELLSAYLDGQLSESDLNTVERKLKTQPEWRLTLDELDQTRRVLRRAPRYRAPRSFALTPEMAAKARRSFLSNLIGLRFSTALAVLSMIAVFVLEGAPLLTNRAAAPMLAAAPQAEALQLDAAPLEEGAAVEKSAEMPAAEATPMIITWGSPADNQFVPGMQVLGKGGGSGGGGDMAIGGGAETMPGGGIVTYDGNPVPGNPALQPPPSVIPMVEEGAAALPEASAERELQGSGPILGVAPAEQAGQILESSAPAGALPAQDLPAEPQGLDGRRLTQLGLAILALAAGAAAVLFALRRRRA